MGKKKIIILDFGTTNVLIYDYDENIWNCPEDMTDEDGNFILDSNCQWMVVDELNIKIN